MNILDVMKSAIQPFLDGEKPPLHVGEVMNLWFFLALAEQTMRGEQVAYNTVKNEELKKFIADLQKIHLEIRNDLIEFCQKEGIQQPKTTPPKNPGHYSNIPEDAKFSDEEAAQLVSENLVVAITFAARGVTEAIRADVGAMFTKFMMLKITFGITYKDFLSRQGWLLTPPPYQSNNITS